MEKMGVLELLDELENVVNAATNVFISNKVMVDKDEVLDLIKDIRVSLPDDVQQARWVREQSNEILNNARKEYETIVMEAKKQADCMVEDHVITERAVQVAEETYRRADQYSKDMTISTYDYVDRMLFDFKEKMNAMNADCAMYIENAYHEFEKGFATFNDQIEKNMHGLRKLADDVKERQLPKHNARVSANFESEE